ALVETFRSSGKFAAAYAESLDNATYIIASAAQPLLLDRAGAARVVGIQAEMLLLGDALANFGIRADLERVGAYKEAYESFAGAPPAFPSPEVREALDDLVDSLHCDLVGAIVRGRGLADAEARERIDDGPYLPEAAEEAGLVDRVIYRDELKDILEGLAKEPVDRVALRKYARAAGGGSGGARIAYIPIVGTIAGGKSRSDSLLGSIAGERTIREALRTAREDDSIRAVILRIASPGGYADASERIWREAMETRKSKPVVASMGGMAASGGYYIAAAANRIVARPATLTGSIGIFGGKLVIGGLYDKLDVGHVAFRRGASAGMESDAQPYTDEQRARVRAELRVLYDGFVRHVAEGRERPAAEIERVAQGRVWSGRRAGERGLVDVLGGIGEAVDEARRLAGIEGGAELVILPESQGFLAQLLGDEDGGILARPGGDGAGTGEGCGADPQGGAIDLAFGPAWRLAAVRLAPLVRPLVLLDGRPLALLPFAVRVDR
ncbi:MAG: signal peptide peptidase SppA, partial [Planctomycetes bacterium]|nr:signal peptide peptidase SppA [Planctomycetota bacterium]